MLFVAMSWEFNKLQENIKIKKLFGVEPYKQFHIELRDFVWLAYGMVVKTAVSWAVVHTDVIDNNGSIKKKEARL